MYDVLLNVSSRTDFVGKVYAGRSRSASGCCLAVNPESAGDAARGGASARGRSIATRGGQAVEKGFFGGTKYTQKVIEQMKKGVGEFHSFTESVTAFEKAGTIKTITGGDGVVRQMLEIPGSYQSSIVRSGGPMSQTENYALLLDEKGVSLHALGLEDISLCRTDALRAIELIRSSSRAILGGDVYFQRAGGIEIAYANWHTDREIGENSTDYVVRSCHESKNYIESFPHLEAAVPLFVFVVSELEDSAR